MWMNLLLWNKSFAGLIPQASSPLQFTPVFSRPICHLGPVGPLNWLGDPAQSSRNWAGSRSWDRNQPWHWNWRLTRGGGTGVWREASRSSSSSVHSSSVYQPSASAEFSSSPHHSSSEDQPSSELWSSVHASTEDQKGSHEAFSPGGFQQIQNVCWVQCLARSFCQVC